MIQNVTEKICTNQTSSNIAQVIELCTMDLSTNFLYNATKCRENENSRNEEVYINIRAKLLVPQRSTSTITPSSCLTISQVSSSELTLMHSSVLNSSLPPMDSTQGSLIF